MNKNIIIAGVVALVLIFGGLYFYNIQTQEKADTKMAQDKDAKMEKDKAMDSETNEATMDKTMQKSDDKMMTSGYVNYSKDSLDNAKSQRRVLFFYASWCPICKPADADLKANINNIPKDVSVIRVNYNDPETDSDEKDLAKKYGVTYQHTFVQIDSQGKELAKWNGGKTAELLTRIK